ncbi:hypothetical protein BDZ45DRAFT_738638 [Acephala macrosclerotiorum]|nr:hypothetical protein BDZ45DRAFT_738638 [Acephala macrosclerotiorum]
MKTQANVRTVVVGCLPQKGPMQAIAGTKGSLRYDAASISSLATYTLLLNSSVELSPLPLFLPPSINVDLSTVVVNFRDQVRREQQGVPLQMVYEPADCRIWYTREIVVDYRVLRQGSTGQEEEGEEGEDGEEPGGGGSGTRGDEPSGTESGRPVQTTDASSGEMIGMGLSAGLVMGVLMVLFALSL